MSASADALDPAGRKAALRREWSLFVEGVTAMTDRLIATDGEEAVEDLHLRARLRGLKAEAFPVDEVSARQAADAFVAGLRGLLVAQRPRRKAILAPFVGAGAKALGELIVDTQELEAAAWQARSGEA